MAELTPTQSLIMEVLGARWRLGHKSWPIEKRFLHQIKALQQAGFIERHRNVNGEVYDVWISEVGVEYVCSDKEYVPPILTPEPDGIAQLAHTPEVTLLCWESGKVTWR